MLAFDPMDGWENLDDVFSVAQDCALSAQSSHPRHLLQKSYSLEHGECYVLMSILL